MRQVVDRRAAVLESLSCRKPCGAEERGLLPEISSLLTGKEKINGVRVTRAVMAGEALHRDAKKHPSNFRRDFVSPVQTVERLQRVTIRNEDATRVRVRRGIEVHS